jgi:hypothetical protein
MKESEAGKTKTCIEVNESTLDRANYPSIISQCHRKTAVQYQSLMGKKTDHGDLMTSKLAMVGLGRHH